MRKKKLTDVKNAMGYNGIQYFIVILTNEIYEKMKKQLYCFSNVKLLLKRVTNVCNRLNIFFHIRQVHHIIFILFFFYYYKII